MAGAWRVSVSVRRVSRGGRSEDARTAAGGCGPVCGVELRGFEPLTFSLRTRRATNCATAPWPCDQVARRPSAGQKIPVGAGAFRIGTALGRGRPAGQPPTARSRCCSVGRHRGGGLGHEGAVGRVAARARRRRARAGRWCAPSGGARLGDVRREGHRQRVPQRAGARSASTATAVMPTGNAEVSSRPLTTWTGGTTGHGDARREAGQVGHDDAGLAGAAAGRARSDRGDHGPPGALLATDQHAGQDQEADDDGDRDRRRPGLQQPGERRRRRRPAVTSSSAPSTTRRRFAAARAAARWARPALPGSRGPARRAAVTRPLGAARDAVGGCSTRPGPSARSAPAVARRVRRSRDGTTRRDSRAVTASRRASTRRSSENLSTARVSPPRRGDAAPWG